MLLWSSVNVTSENYSLRLPIHAVPQVTSVREGRVSVPTRPCTDFLEDPQCIFCAISRTSPEALVLIALFISENKGVVSHGDSIHSDVASCLLCTALVSFLHKRLLSTHQVPGTEVNTERFTCYSASPCRCLQIPVT